MKIDALVYEIGSTITVVSAFDQLTSNPHFLGQGFAKTSVVQGDVRIGIEQALLDLQNHLKTPLEAKQTFACSSAAGGLKMSVHGLVYDMTVKAAKEAALGAGANIKFLTSGLLSNTDLDKIKTLGLNIILISGGVDYGERETALSNAKAIASMMLNIPVIYCGNIANQDAIKDIFALNHQSGYLFITENVYPRIDTLQVEEVRQLIQQVFEKHIIEAPGMEHVREVINGVIMPTPKAVMDAAILLQKDLGDLICVDVGGATTDVHSVCEDNPEHAKMLLNPEPFAKRTVEGDLGVYINKDNLISLIGEKKLLQELNISSNQMQKLINDYQPIPTDNQIPFVSRLTEEALSQSLNRHVGKYVTIYGSSGKTKTIEGKDLTSVQFFIATGGALTKLPKGKQLIEKVLKSSHDQLLLPKNNLFILLDQNYIMAALGVLSKSYPVAALKLLKESLGWEKNNVSLH
ncbi:MAG: GlmL-related ornithine degradation protein [Bacilli bacterium]